MPAWLISIGEHYGPIVMLIAVYVWRDIVREDKMGKRLTDLEGMIQGELKSLLTKCLGVIEDNTKVLGTFVRNRDLKELLSDAGFKGHGKRNDD